MDTSNRNHRNSNDKTYVLVVRNRTDLATKVVPFFRAYELKTTKRADYERFGQVVEMMMEGKHLDLKGLRQILKIAFQMNQAGARRRMLLETILADLEPSETVRRTLTQVG